MKAQAQNTQLLSLARRTKSEQNFSKTKITEPKYTDIVEGHSRHRQEGHVSYENVPLGLSSAAECKSISSIPAAASYNMKGLRGRTLLRINPGAMDFDESHTYSEVDIKDKSSMKPADVPRTVTDTHGIVNIQLKEGDRDEDGYEVPIRRLN